MFLILKFVDVVFVPSLRCLSMANRLPPVSDSKDPFRDIVCLDVFCLPTGNLMIGIEVRNRLYENLPLVPNLHQLNLGPASYGYTPDLFRFRYISVEL